MNSGSTIRKEIITTPKEFTAVHLTLLNSLLPNKLTNKEIETLSSFINMEENVVAIDGLFGAACRKVVKKECKLSTAHLGNIIKSLKDKKYIYEQDGHLMIVNYLAVKPDENKLVDGESYFVLNYSFVVKSKMHE